MKTFTIAAALSVLLCSIAAAATPQPALQAVSIHIGRQPVVDAVTELGRQTGVHVVMDAALARGLMAPAISGRLTFQEAMASILKDTGLRFEFLDDKTVTIAPVTVPLEGASANAAQTDLMRSTDTPLHLKVAQENSSSSREGRGTESEGSQPSDKKDDSQLQEIVVTAQKRKELLKDVPISISVLSGADLDRSTVDGLTDALSRVPGTAISTANFGGGAQLTVRGVTSGGALFAGSSPVSYYLDSVPFGLVRQAIVPDANPYDLERVEVLRGPQGTLYGASAQNGVVRVLTKDANPNGFELKARTSTSSTEDGGWNYRGDVAVNAPLIAGKLAARAVVGYQDLAGWIDRPTQRDANDAQIRNARIKINALPCENLSVGLSAWISRADYGAPPFGDANGLYGVSRAEPMSTDFDVYSGKIGYDFGSFSIASVTSYLDYANSGALDIGALVPSQLPLNETLLDADVFAQEINLTSTQAGAWRWSLGGIYRDAKDRQFQRSNRAVQGDVVLQVDQTYSSESFAVFGELTRVLLDGRFELTAGLRYFEDKVAGRDDLRIVAKSDRFDALSPRVALTWHPAAGLTVYGSYAEGFRSGFPQAGTILVTAPQFAPLKADTLHNYELGMKGGLWDNRIGFDTAVYYMDWRNVQQSLTVPVPGFPAGSIANVNAASASGVGVDFGVTARLTDQVEIGTNFSWNDLAMDSNVISSGAVLFAEGDRLNSSPEYTASAFLNYAFPLSAGFEGKFSASGNYTSGGDLRTITGGQQVMATGDSMLITRLSFDVVAPKNWTATLFIDNLSNEEGSPTRYPIGRPIILWDTRVRPRTIGAQLEWHF